MSERKDLRKVCKLYFPGVIDSEAKPCPSCGKSDKIWTVIAASCESGIGCKRCRLALTRPFPVYWPKDSPPNLRPGHKLDWLYMRGFFIVLKRWNNLPRR